MSSHWLLWCALVCFGLVWFGLVDFDEDDEYGDDTHRYVRRRPQLTHLSAELPQLLNYFHSGLPLIYHYRPLDGDDGHDELR